jgi:hypothetical protein
MPGGLVAGFKILPQRLINVNIIVEGACNINIVFTGEFWYNSR